MNRYHTIFAPFPSLPSTRGRVVRDPKGTRESGASLNKKTYERNLTKMGRIAKHPEVHAAVGKAEEVLRGWMAEELKARKAARDRNEREAKELETALTQTYAGR
jgi:hypothetical protein